MLIDMYSLVESVVGSSLIIWGLALIVNQRIIQSFFNTFINIKNNETLSYLTASMFLILGLITIWVHNDWYWGIAIIVTLMGWILTIKASLWLLFPLYFSWLTKKFFPFTLNFWFRIVYGLVTLILGLLILGAHYIEDIILWVS